MGEYRKLCGKCFTDVMACILDAEHVGQHEYADLNAKADANVYLRAEVIRFREISVLGRTALQDATASLVWIAEYMAGKKEMDAPVDAAQLLKFCEAALDSIAKTISEK